MYTHAKSNDVLPDSPSAMGGLLIGKVVSLNSHGNPLIAYDEQTQQAPVEALTTVPLDSASIGKEVAISFAQNNGGTAIVMGIIRRALDDVLAQQFSENQSAQSSETANLSEQVEVISDGKKLELTAAEEITLRCGKASITLKKNGKILIKGEHMLNRTAGSYQVKSGSIQLN